MKKKITGVGAALLLALTLAGCGSGAGTQADPWEGPGDNRWVQMEDGRTVYCYYYDRGVSCDWEGARNG